MYKNRMLKVVLVGTFASIAAPSYAEIEKTDHTQYLADFSDPLAVFTSAGIGSSNGGVDVNASIGGYLGGSFKHQLQFVAKDSFEYYDVNYMAVDTSSDTAFLIDSTWSRDFLGTDDVNDTSFGVMKQIGILDGRLKFYPEMKLGFLWGDEISSTTYLELAVGARYIVTSGLWVGMTPSYSYGFDGCKLDRWNTSFEAGYMFKEGIGLSVETVIDTYNDTEYRGNITFAF